MEIEREIVLPVPPDEAWEALTEPEQLEEWFANDVELDTRPGGVGVFRWDDGDVRHAVVETVEESGAARAALGRRRRGRADARRAPRRHPGARPRVVTRVEHGARASCERGVGDRVDAVFDALADPSRRYLVERLAELGAATPTAARRRALDDAPGGDEAPRATRARGARVRQAARGATPSTAPTRPRCASRRPWLESRRRASGTRASPRWPPRRAA